jgi:hypothetical protein
MEPATGIEPAASELSFAQSYADSARGVLDQRYLSLDAEPSGRV